MRSRRSAYVLTRGDVFEIATPRGLAYLQYLRDDPLQGALVRVLDGFEVSRPESVVHLVHKKERFFTFFPVMEALKKRILGFVANAPVPHEFAEPPGFRSPGYIDPVAKRVRDWWVSSGPLTVRVNTLSEEQRRFAIDGVINDTLLVEYLVSGWKPEDDV